MINIENLHNKIIPNDILGTFGITLSDDLVKNGYIITKNPNFNHLFMFNPYGELVSTDNPHYILGYSPALLNVDYKSIFIGGLGLGVMPYVSQDFCDIIDVVEINQDIIDLSKQLGHLNENVNIIKDDIFSYTIEKTYDIIVLDIWYNALSDKFTDELINRFLPFVNDGGFLYIPINYGVLEDKKIIFK